MPDGGMAMRQFMAKEVSTLELELTTKEVRYTLRVHDAGRVVIVEGHRYRDDDPSS